MLIEELSSASGNARALDVAAAAELAEEDGDDGDWEDVPNALDLGLNVTKQELMAYGDGTGNFSTRQRDDETQAFLTAFFQDVSAKNIGGFADMYGALTADEQQKLSVLGQ